MVQICHQRDTETHGICAIDAICHIVNVTKNCMLPCNNLSEIVLMQHVLCRVYFLKRNIGGALFWQQWLNLTVAAIAAS